MNGLRSASGARIAGDEYQHLVAWCYALRSLLPGSVVATFSVEAIDAGAVDDIVLLNSTPPHQYTQVKYAVDASTPLSTAWLLEARKSGGNSILQRFYSSWIQIDGLPGDVEMRLVTNRNIDPADRLLALKDSRTELLVPAAEQKASTRPVGNVLNEWADHLHIDVAELLEMLRHLQLFCGLSQRQQIEHAESLMCANGLRFDEDAMVLGLSLVRSWVIDGRRELTLDELRHEVDGLDIRREPQQALLVIQAIEKDPYSDDATVSLDWQDHYAGDRPAQRRVPYDPHAWDTMLTDLQNAAREIRSSGLNRVLVRASIRLPAWFAVGFEFRHVTSSHVACRQGMDLWSSEADLTDALGLNVQETDIGLGEDLAVSVGISAPLSADVEAYIRNACIGVSRLISVEPQNGTNDQAIRTAGEAVATAAAIRDVTRRISSDSGSQRIHLFLSTPAGFALLLGHRWNRLPETVTYEDCGPGLGYCSAFVIG